MPWTDEVRSAINSKFADRLINQHSSPMYMQVSDLRLIGIPAIVSAGHKHHDKLGPKIELVRVGDMHYSDMVGTLERMLKGDVEDCSIMRGDLTTDLAGVSVDALARAHWAKHKRTNQDVGETYLEPFRRVTKLGAQTLYHGIKPRQIRIYDKTRHRLHVLLKELNKERRRARLGPLQFEEAFGYDRRDVVTRLERQMGDREMEQAWGIRELGNLGHLMKVDPFAQLMFASDAAPGVSLEELSSTMRLLIEMLRSRVESDGVDWTRSYIRTFYDKPHSFREFWRRYSSLIVSGSGVPSREVLTRQFHDSLARQLAA
jgi:hypothetical protein